MYISRIVQRRRNNTIGQQTTTNESNEENRQSLVLFGVVILFLVCNVPRIVLNTYEVFTVNIFKKNVDNECYRLPLWVMITNSLSLILMTMNSSTNFFVYCFLNPSFRKEFFRRLHEFVAKFRKPGINGSSNMPMSQIRRRQTVQQNDNKDPDTHIHSTTVANNSTEIWWIGQFD